MQAFHLLFLFFYFIYFPSHRKNNNNTNWLYVIRVFFFSIHHSLCPGGLLHFVIYIEIKKNKLNDAYAHICLLVVAVLPFSSSLFGIHPCVLSNFAHASKFTALICQRRGKNLKYIVSPFAATNEPLVSFQIKNIFGPNFFIFKSI